VSTTLAANVTFADPVAWGRDALWTVSVRCITVTLTHRPDEPRVQLWDADESTTGSVRWSATLSDPVYPEWWGAVQGVTTTANQTFFRAAVLSFSGTDGGVISCAGGKYWFTDKLELFNTNISAGGTLSIEGTRFPITILELNNSTPTDNRFLSYDNTSGATHHRVNLRDLWIDNNDATVVRVSWHAADGFWAKDGLRNSHWENVRFQSWTRAVFWGATGTAPLGSWLNKLDRVVVNGSFNGFVFDNAANNHTFTHTSIFDSGKDADGTGSGIELLTTGNMQSFTCLGCNFEDSRAPFVRIPRAAHGLAFLGGDIESNTNSRAFHFGDNTMTDAQLSNNLNWVNGVTLSGIRFWNNLGVLISHGVAGLTVESCAWFSPWTEAAPGGSVLSSAANPEVQIDATEIRYILGITLDDSNQWMWNSRPAITDALNDNVFMNGIRYKEATPNTAGVIYVLGDVFRDRSTPHQGWAVTTAGHGRHAQRGGDDGEY
jgi:hypothetical protein